MPVGPPNCLTEAVAQADRPVTTGASTDKLHGLINRAGAARGQSDNASQVPARHSAPEQPPSAAQGHAGSP